jgi:hypothetical protein
MSRSICGVCLCPYGDSGECACEIKGNGMNNYAQATQEVRDAFNSLCRGWVEAAVKAEREACAKVCEQEWNKYCDEPYGYALAVKECAAAIRARGEASIRSNNDH